MFLDQFFFHYISFYIMALRAIISLSYMLNKSKSSLYQLGQTKTKRMTNRQTIVVIFALQMKINFRLLSICSKFNELIFK